jgi:hypothetical protein
MHLQSHNLTVKNAVLKLSLIKIFQTRDIIHSEKVGSALTEIENLDLLVDCTSRDGRQMLDACVHLSDKRTLLMIIVRNLNYRP